MDTQAKPLEGHPSLMETTPEPDQIPPPQPAPDAIPTGTTPYANPSAVLVIPRAVFNYVIIAITFFVLGAVTSAAGLGALYDANSQENRALIDAAVASAAEARPETAGTDTEPNPNERYNVTADDDPFLGAADAQVVVIEFSDFNCGFCGRYARETLNPLVAEFGDQVKFVYRDYPFLAQSSLDAAMAAQCAFEQGQDKFWLYHNALFANQGQFGRDLFLRIAEQNGLDVAAFTTCLDSGKYRDEVVNDAITAQELGVRGTPAFFINGRFVSGAQPYSVFANIINEELAAATTTDTTS